MLNVVDAAKKLIEMDSGLTITQCRDYDSDYLFTAFRNEKDLDPFYLVNKETGKISSYTIAKDPKRYYSSKTISFGKEE